MQKIESKYADGEWRLSLGDHPLLALECASDSDSQPQFKRFDFGIAWRFHIKRGADCTVPDAATFSWRHPVGTDATTPAAHEGASDEAAPAAAACGCAPFSRSPILSLSTLATPAFLRHSHGAMALLACPEAPAAAHRATGLGRDGAPRWNFSLPFRKSRGGGASTPWMYLFAAIAPCQLLDALHAAFGDASQALALGVVSISGSRGRAAELALDFIARPADEERWLRCSPGEYATVAKRFGDTWVAAALNNGRARVQTLMLDFLPDGVEYDMDGECDDPSECLAHPLPSDPSVLPPPGTPWTRRDKVSVSMAANGGCVIALVPRRQRPDA